MSVDRLIRSVDPTLDTLSPPDLADLCPRLAVLDDRGGAAALDVSIDDDGRPGVPVGERVLLRASALVRAHVAVDGRDGRPLRHGPGPQARLLAVAAGAGPVVVTVERVVGILRATGDRPALAYAIAWTEIDDVSPAPSGGVLLASTQLLGGLTVDVVGPLPVVD